MKDNTEMEAVSLHRMLAILIPQWESLTTRMGTDQYIRLQKLSQAIPSDTFVKELRSVFCAVFTSSEESQELFYDLFDRLQGEFEILEPDTLKTEVPETKSSNRNQPNGTTTQPDTHGKDLDPKTKPNDTNQPISEPDSPALISPELSEQKRKNEIILDYENSSSPPVTWNIALEIINEKTLDTGERFRKTVTQLRRREYDQNQELDIAMTIRATLGQAGMPVFRYRLRTRPTEYLLLVERFSTNDHRAAIFDTLYKTLKTNEILTERFFYNGNLDLCRNEQYPEGLYLHELNYRYPNARLLVLGAGYRLISPINGQLVKLAKILQRWNTRHLLTPVAREKWTGRERLLAKIFTLLPAAVESLQFAAEHQGETLTTYDRLPDYLRHIAESKPISIEGNPMHLLGRHYDTWQLHWIAACAIYPGLYYNLTLFIGRVLEKLSGLPLVNAANLLKMTRLPWFTQGRMPKDIRQNLIEYLHQQSPEVYQAVLKSLTTLMEKNPPPLESMAWAEHRINLALWKTQSGQIIEEKELEDLKEFLTIKAVDKVSVGDFLVPEGWAKFVNKLEKNKKKQPTKSKKYITTPLSDFQVGAKFVLEELKQLLMVGKTAEAIARLNDYKIEDQDLLDALDINAGRLASLETRVIKGVLSFDEANLLRNKINDALILAINKLSPAGTTRTDIYHLPDLQPHFTGREPELALLDAAWANPQTNLLQFVAPGGTGKTMLLTYWLHHRLLAHPVQQPDSVYAWSFYSQGSDEGRQSSSDFFFAAAARFFGIELSKDPTERGRELARHLRQQRCLLILDGTEPLQYPLGTPGGLGGKLKDPALAALLRELAFSQPGLCLISTRVAIENVASIEPPRHSCLRLDNFSPRDGAQLLKKLGVKGSPAELEAAAAEYKGYALALRLLGNYLADLLDGDIRQRDRIPHLTDGEQQGEHARRVMQAYVRWFEQAHREAGHTGTPPELILLRLMGLFDRPAPVEALEALATPPTIGGLTDGLANLTPENVRRAYEHLKKLGLLEENRPKTTAAPKNLPHLPALRHLDSVDAHPLVREHLGQQLEHEQSAAWREANTRLYHFYKNLPEKHQPDTLEEMEPLFTAMMFGARAGLQQEVLNEVYWARIRRREKAYSVKQLGAYGMDLAGLATLFETPWSQPSNKMNEAEQAWLLSMAGFGLRGLGRLREAAEPMRASMKMSESQNNWKSTAQDANNLSELFLTLGVLNEAVDFGRQSVDFADRSKDSDWPYVIRTTLADALHQAGQNTEAEKLFAEAEAMQQERRSEYRFLYSVQGYKYCDLLLVLGKWAEVLERAEEGLKIAIHNNWLLDIALDHLSIARAHAAAIQSEDTPTHREAAEQYFNRAVEGFRRAGAIEFIAKGLIDRAQWRLQTNRRAAALEDLDEVYEIAENGSMGLYLVDWHIAMSRLRRLEEDHAAAEQHKIEAVRRVRETGYLRRLEEAEGLLSESGFTGF